MMTPYERYGVLNNQQFDSLCKDMFMLATRETTKLHIIIGPS